MNAFMDDFRPSADSATRRRLRLATATAAWLLCGLLVGCASVTNPVAEGVPVDRLPPEFLATPKADERPIPLALLRQKPPDVYRLGPKDIVGVYIEGVLGERANPLPVRLSEQTNVPPALGYPLPVSADGTLPLPQIKPLRVEGMTLEEAREAIGQAYLMPKEILKPGQERILVSLIRRRQYQVLVVREDGGQVAVGAGGVLGGNRRGTGAVVDLPAYENDVLNALTRTGGLPGLDAINEIVIQRGNVTTREGALLALQASWDDQHQASSKVSPTIQIVRIPLRLRRGEEPPFSPEDVILHDGDIVFIQARDTEVFYTGGLLLPKQFVLPRDLDLDVVGAISLAGGPLVNGGVNQNNLSGAIVASGLGGPSPSHVSVLRKTKGRGQVVIIVDLNKALQDPHENILIQPGDVVILQESVGESVTRYITTVWRFNFLGALIQRRDLVGTTTLGIP
jgi:protein involved in polysaccharide export with SLBB domain